MSGKRIRDCGGKDDKGGANQQRGNQRPCAGGPERSEGDGECYRGAEKIAGGGADICSISEFSSEKDDAYRLKLPENSPDILRDDGNQLRLLFYITEICAKQKLFVYDDNHTIAIRMN